MEKNFDNELANNRYLRYWPWVMAASVIAVVFDMVCKYFRFGYYTAGEAPVGFQFYLVYELVALVSKALVIIAIAKVFKLGQKVMYVLGLMVISSAIVLAFNSQKTQADSALFDLPKLLFYTFFNVLPFVFMGWLILRRTQTLVKMSIFLVFSIGISLMQGGIQTFFNGFVEESLRIFFDFDTIQYVAFCFAPFWFVNYIFLCELIFGIQKGARRDWSVFNFNNGYTKLEASIVFYTCAVGILGLLAGMIRALSSLVTTFLFSQEENIFRETNFFTSSVYAVQLICSLVALVWLLHYMRHFLYEFFISRGKAPFWRYWLLQIPVLSWFIWPIVVLSLPSASASFAKRVEAFDAAPYHPSLTAIKGILIIVSMLSTIYAAVVSDDMLVSLSLLVTVSCYIWFLVDQRGYQVYMLLLIIGIALNFVFIKEIKSPILLIQSVVGCIAAFMMFPLLHATAFEREYIPIELDDEAPEDEYVNILL